MINSAIASSEARHIWATPDWLPQEIGIIVDQGQFYCYEGQDLALHIQRGVYNVQVYELVGVVADINSGENQKPHLVSLINGNTSQKPSSWQVLMLFALVAPSSTDPEVADEWHLFNDFLVRQTTKEDALRFDPTWKLPSVLAYQLKSASHLIDEGWKETMDTSILYHQWSPL
jgi:PAB-dependent poly(A)-specific ribonuclease subunit 2